MGGKLHYARVIWLASALVAGFVLLAARLVYLQIVRHDELSELVDQNTKRQFLLEPRRGDILDVKGNLLATSTFVKTVCADPTLLGNRQAEVARALEPLLEIPAARLYQALLPRVRTNADGTAVSVKYVPLKRKVSTETWARIQSAMLGLNFHIDEARLPKSEQTFYRQLRERAVFCDPVDDQLRVYPNKALAAHVLGYVGVSEGEFGGRRLTETSGKDGIELSLNTKLSGVRGWLKTETDFRKREIVRRREQDVDAQDGLNVVLTIDAVIQHIVETALAEAYKKHSPLSASCLVVRPRTGEILAMASLPNFDPNDLGSSSPDSRRNRMITDIVEPGSTFKVVVASAVLNEKMARLGEVFNCENGVFNYGGRTLHDHESYSALTLEGIITKSSNIGAAKLGIRLGEDNLYEYMRQFGFGQPTGIPLRGEQRGIVHPVKNWSKVSIAQIPMGHGIAVTRMQMIMAVCAIANDGWLMRPMLISRLEDREHQVVAGYEPLRVRQVISTETAHDMVKALKTVVSTNGTAVKAALQNYTVAGKTGTAQKVENGRYVHGKYFSSFIGFFPADDPELCISVMLDEPKQGYYGGQTAAPAFKQIAERAANYLNIRPDKLVDPAPGDFVALAPPDLSATRTPARARTNPPND
jgi:cell division protein FtsI/penicillin-binding protein 2